MWTLMLMKCHIYVTDAESLPYINLQMNVIDIWVQYGPY